MSKTARLVLVKPTHGINEVEGETGGVPNEAVNLDLIDAAIAALQDSAQRVTIKLTSAQLKALPGTTIQLLPAPGAGKYYIVFHAVATYKFGTVAYTIGNADNFIVFTQGGQYFVGIIPTNLVDQASSKAVLSSASSTPAVEASILNQPLVVSLIGTTPALTLGDGTLQIDALVGIVTVL